MLVWAVMVHMLKYAPMGIAPHRPITTWSADHDRPVQSGMVAASVTLPQ